MDSRSIISSAEQDPFNIGIKKSLENVHGYDSESYDPTQPATWPLEQVKAAAQHFERADQRQVAISQSQKDADAFVAAHPVYVDSDKNNLQMKNYWSSRGVEAPNYQQWCEAYEQLKNGGCLALNASELRKEQTASGKARAAAIEKRNSFNEDEAYSMSMEDLRMKANGAL